MKKIKWKVYTPVGRVIIDPLPHAHRSAWTIGEPDSISSHGDFVIPLLAADDSYDRLEIGQRVEAYEGGSIMPIFVGIIEDRIDNHLYGRGLS